MEFKIIHTFLGFREVWYIEDNIHNNAKLAKEMGLSYYNFKAVINNQFNGQCMNASNIFFFKNEKDAQDALVWIETTIVANRLAGN